MPLITFKHAIATRIPKQPARTSLDIHQYLKTINNYQYQNLRLLWPTMESQSSLNSPRKDKKCNNWGIIGHFAKKCRKPKRPQGQVPKAAQTNVNQIVIFPEKSDDEESVNNITSYQQLYDKVYDSNYDSDSTDYVSAVSCGLANQLEPLNAKIQFGKVQANAMIDSGSVVSLITKTLANRIFRTTPSVKLITKRRRGT